MRLLAADLIATGQVRPSLDLSEVADTLWATNSPELILLLTRDRRWTHLHYDDGCSIAGIGCCSLSRRDAAALILSFPGKCRDEGPRFQKKGQAGLLVWRRDADPLLHGASRSR